MLKKEKTLVKCPWIDEWCPILKIDSDPNNPMCIERKEFKATLRESLKNSKTIITGLGRCNKYRGVGKSTIMAGYVMSEEDKCLLVFSHTIKNIFIDKFGIPSEKIIATGDLEDNVDYIKGKQIVMDDIPYAEYKEVCEKISPIKNEVKLSGTVVLESDYIVF